MTFPLEIVESYHRFSRNIIEATLRLFHDLRHINASRIIHALEEGMASIENRHYRFHDFLGAARRPHARKAPPQKCNLIDAAADVKSRRIS